MPMNELNSSEVEKVLLFVSDARQRAAKARARLEKVGAEPHVLRALQETEDSLASSHRNLMQATYFAVPDRSEQIAI